jgi:hypothetical protein
MIFKHLGFNVFLINEIGFWWCALIIICKLGEEAFSPWCGGIDVINQELEDGRRKKVKKSEGVDEKLGLMKDIHKVPKIAGANLEFGQKTR